MYVKLFYMQCFFYLCKFNKNVFPLSFHCVAHRTNLASDCKVISYEIDTSFNAMATGFIILKKREHALRAF